jgi:hypothetical protein
MLFTIRHAIFRAVTHSMRLVTMPRIIPLSLLVAVLLISASSYAWVTGHHGALITHCTAPRFFEEFPDRDAKVARMDGFAFTASENTHAESLEVRINTQPVPIQITPQRSGRLRVEGQLPQPVAQGRVWIKVTGTSDDGCDELHTWNVYVGQ